VPNFVEGIAGVGVLFFLLDMLFSRASIGSSLAGVGLGPVLVTSVVWLLAGVVWAFLLLPASGLSLFVSKLSTDSTVRLVVEGLGSLIAATGFLAIDGSSGLDERTDCFWKKIHFLVNEFNRLSGEKMVYLWFFPLLSVSLGASLVFFIILFFCCFPLVDVRG